MNMGQNVGGASIYELENRAVHLKMKEDEQKLSFNRGAAARKSAMMQYNSSGQIHGEYDDGVSPSVATRGHTYGGMASHL